MRALHARRLPQVLLFLVLAAASACPKPRKMTTLQSVSDVRTSAMIVRSPTAAIPADSLRTVTFPQPMRPSAVVVAEIFDGLTWVQATGAASFWKDERTLVLFSAWQRLPEAARMRFVASGLQTQAGQPVPPHVEGIETTVRPVPFGISDTGQETCFDGAIARRCPAHGFPGQDAETNGTPAERQFGHPTRSDDLPDDLTTEDPVAGLTWKTCSEGQSGPDCAIGTAQRMNWYRALHACAPLNEAHGGQGYAGRNNWRLPTIAELEGLIHFGHVDPALDSEAFPRTAIDRPYWVATAYGGNSAYAWSVFFHDGDVTTQNRAIPGHVRCVSEGPARAASPPFTVHADGTVTDARTHLRWMHCTAGLGGAHCEQGATGTYTWEEALNYCNNATFAGRRWRLPSVNELKSLIEREHNHPDPAIDARTFPATVPSVYWTSTTAAPLTINSWYVGFGGGFGSIYRKTCHYYVRCVTEE